MDDLDYSKQLDEDSLNYIIQRYKEVHNKNVKYKYIEEYGVYVFVDADIDDETFNNDEELIKSNKLDGYCSGDSTLGEAITTLDNQFNDSNQNDGMNGPSVGGQRRGTSRAGNTTKPINLNIDEKEFEEVLTKLQSVESDAEELSSFEGLSGHLSGKLKSFYESSNNIKNCEAKYIKEYVGDLSVKVQSCVDMIKDTDDGLKQMLGPIIDKLFSLGYNKVYQEQTVEEQKKYLTDMIAAANETLNTLKETYKEFADIGFEDYDLLWPLFWALGYNNNDYLYEPTEGNIDYDMLNEMLSFLKENNVVENFVAYMNGASFDSTLKDLMVNKYDTETDFIVYLGDALEGTYGDKWGFKVYEEDFGDCVNELKNLLVEKGLLTVGEDGKYTSSIISKVETDLEKYATLVSEITTLEFSIEEMKSQLELADFEIDKNSREYWKYLTKTYTSSDVKNSVLKIVGLLKDVSLIKDIDTENYIYYGMYDGEYNGILNYLTQDEFALLQYYLENDKSKVNDYLKALHDTLNQRKGYDEACKTLYENGGISVWEAALDGINQWFDNLSSLFLMGDSPISAANYKNMFILQLLEVAKKPRGERGEYEELLAKIDPVEAWTNKISYTVANQIGNMAVPMIAAAALSLATGGASFAVFGHSFKWSALLGSSLVGMGAAGSAMAQAYSRGGLNRLEIISYGLLSGLSETTLMMLLSKIPLIGGAFSESEAAGLMGILKSGLGEAKEEFIQAFVENLLNTIYFHDEFNFIDTLSEATVSAFYGFLTSAVMSGGYVTFRVVINGVPTLIKTTPEKALNLLNEAKGDFSKFLEKVGNILIPSASAEGSDTTVTNLNNLAEDAAYQSGSYRVQEISPAMLLEYNIKLKAGDKLYCNPETGTYWRINADGTITTLPSNIFDTNNKGARLEYDGARGVWIDKVTGIETPEHPGYGDVVKHVCEGEFRGEDRPPAGLHSYEDIMRLEREGKIVIDSKTRNADGTWNIKWRYTYQEDGVTKTTPPKESTTFPDDWSREDIENCIDDFINDKNKKPYRFQAGDNKGGNSGGVYLYEYEHNGKKIILEVQVIDGEVKSIYPYDPNYYTDEKPNVVQ